MEVKNITIGKKITTQKDYINLKLIDWVATNK